MPQQLRTAPSNTLPLSTRPVFFAANELLLELIGIAQGYAKTDLESLLIILCVSNATMRPFMLNSSGQPITTSELVDETLRGSISRRTVATETGLPRETVRRKVDELTDAGLLIVDDRGRLRSTPLLGDPDLQRAIDAMDGAVRRYQTRLSQFHVRLRGV